MSLSPQDISRIANLARLALEPAESERLRGQINGFFDIVAQMQAVDTTGIMPLAHPVHTLGDTALRLRDDTVSEPMGAEPRDQRQRSAPAVDAGLFLVPKVIE
jgi:aspartyl-tRNA(Asn)/glutamyl-tRNA(Gln) amidotransferase subunit C